MKDDALQLSIDRCPVCDSTAIAPAGLTETYFPRNLNRRVTVEFGACAQCAFTFQLNPLTPAALEKYYEDNSQLRSSALDVVEEYVHSRQAAFIETVVPLRAARVLEIGSSTGKFLDFLKQVYAAETYFDEKNPDARRHLVRSGGHHPIEDLEGGVNIDVLVLRHIVEHVPEPRDWLASMRSRLGSSGHLFIEVPDWSFIDAQTNTIAFEHVSHFSQHTLSYLLFRAGYIVVQQEMSITEGYGTSGGDRVLRVMARPFPSTLANGAAAALRQHHFERVGRPLAAAERIVKAARAGGKTVALYGASWGAERAFLNTSIRAEDLVCIFDRDKRKQGTPFHDVPVYDPSRIVELRPDIVLIYTSHAPAVKRDLRALGYEGELFSREDFERSA